MSGLKLIYVNKRWSLRKGALDRFGDGHGDDDDDHSDSGRGDGGGDGGGDIW